MIRRSRFAFLLLMFTMCGGVAVIAAQESLSPKIPSPQAIPPDTVITLERTGCFGTCPMYTLNIDAAGKVVFEGKMYVKTEGRVESKITEGQLQDLIAQFDRIKYFTLRDKYEDRKDGCPTAWTDMPGAITSIKARGKYKSISHSYGCRERGAESPLGRVFPRELTELEAKIDEIAGTRQWVR
jgi:hypothetical protein